MKRKFAPGAIVAASGLGDRQIKVVASDATPDRDGDVMRPEGCRLANYARNPIVLADHDPSKPIGRAEMAIEGDQLVALITFAPAGAAAKADEYCALAKAGVLNAVSVGFLPIECDQIRGGGLVIKEWELMELSVVAVPANPSATVIGRSAGTKEAASWKCAASRNLPTVDKDGWDGPAAETRIFAKAGFDTDTPDTVWAKKAFLAVDAAAPKLKGSYKLPIADVIDGRLTVTAGAVKAAAARLDATEIPDDVKTSAGEVLDGYKKKLDIGQDGKRGATQAKTLVGRLKGLYGVARLAYLVEELGYAHDMSAWEEAMEEDPSKVPAMLGAALAQLGAALIAMTQEEVAELLAGIDVDAGVDAGSAEGETIIVTAAAGAARRKAFVAALAKAGRVLSAANAEHVEKAMDCLDKAADLMTDLQTVQDHIAEASKHVTAVHKSRRKPASGSGDGSSSDDGDADGSNADPDNDDDNELAAAVAQRKRIVDVMALADAP